MHVFLGFTIGEWGNFITIATVCTGLFTWIIRVALVNPLQNSIQELTSQIRDLKMDSKEEHEHFTESLNDHEQRLNDHQTSITVIEKEIEEKK